MVAGSLGAAARYGLDGFVAGRVGTGFPWGTFAVNMTGSFALGLVYSLLLERLTVDPSMRLAITTGFIGSYTTFSTLSLETVRLVQNGYWVGAVANSFGSIVGGFLAVVCGLLAGRLL